LKEGNLLVGQVEFVGKSQLLWLRQPRGHEAFRSYRGDLAGPGLCVRVSKQRKRATFAEPVARGTIMKKDGSDIAIEGDLLRDR
jgi:hypothetical protein